MNLILKLSGEVLKNNDLENSGNELACFLKKLKEDNHNVAVVIGGGNLFRGRSHTDMDERDRDTIGMLASITNALYIHDFLLKNNIESIVVTPFNFNELITSYSDDELINIYQNKIIIFGAGIGKCGYSTDTKCFESAKLFGADYIMKLTNVDGIYDKDPNKYNDAKFIKKISYDDVLNNKLNVMDLNMIDACKINGIKIKILNYKDHDNLFDKNIGSIIGD